ncbi:MAG: PfkB family carbohydrate kinase, partial [Acidimicrobiales bacterium]
MPAAPRVIVVGEILADIAVPDIALAASPPTIAASPPAIAASPPAIAASPPAGEATLALHARPGGSPANVALGLARLGIPDAFAGRLSRDGRGRGLGDHHAAGGVDLSLSVRATEPPS